MATAEQARLTYEATKDFYKRDLKSSNKEYEDRDKLAKVFGSVKANSRVDRRALRFPMAEGLINQDNFSGQTPLEVGATLYGAIRGQRAGNCGQMACVAIYIASMKGVAPNDMWLVTASNPNIKPSAWSYFESHYGLPMSFSHQWAEFGPPRQGFIVDPWGDYWCARSAHTITFKAKLDKWQREGKRINVGWGDGATGVGVWTNANDGAILSLLDEGTRKTWALTSDHRIP
jgi:hypothetical protein